MVERLLAKADVLAVMRRLGMVDRMAEAERRLPDVIRLDRDGDLLESFGLDVDRVTDRLGGSP